MKVNYRLSIVSNIIIGTVKSMVEEVANCNRFRSMNEETVIKLFQYDCEKSPGIRVIKTQKQKGS